MVRPRRKVADYLDAWPADGTPTEPSSAEPEQEADGGRDEQSTEHEDVGFKEVEVATSSAGVSAQRLVSTSLQFPRDREPFRLDEKWRARGTNAEGGRFGTRGGAGNPNVDWHRRRIKAAKAGPDQLKHFHRNNPKPQRTAAMVEWARLKNIAHAKGEVEEFMRLNPKPSE